MKRQFYFSCSPKVARRRDGEQAYRRVRCVIVYGRSFHIALRGFALSVRLSWIAGDNAKLSRLSFGTVNCLLDGSDITVDSCTAVGDRKDY